MPASLRTILLVLGLVGLLDQQLPAQICGDCNADGALSILDALHAAQISAALVAVPTPQCFPAFAVCNVSGDLCPSPTSAITVVDALLLAQAAAGLPVVLDCGTALGAPPSCAITSPLAGMVVQADAPITFDLLDPDTLSITVEFRFSTDSGATFALATPAATSPSPYDVNPTVGPPGTSQVFIWDTLSDLPGTMIAVVFQIEVDDGLSPSTCEVGLTVDNQSWMACVGFGASILQNPGFETGDMSGWSPTAFQIDTRPHDGNYSSFCFGNNPLTQVFPAVPCNLITKFKYWGYHPNEDVFGVTYLHYSDGTMQNVIHPNWMAWREFDLIGNLDLSKSLVRIDVWGYSGGGPGVDETVFDSFELCWIP